MVGTNPLGEVYLSPLSAIINQVQSRYPGVSATLPPPAPTLTDLISHHLSQKQTEVASYLLQFLKEAYQDKIWPKPKEPKASRGRHDLVPSAPPKLTAGKKRADNFLEQKVSAGAQSHENTKNTGHIEHIAFAAAAKKTHINRLREVTEKIRETSRNAESTRKLGKFLKYS